MRLWVDDLREPPDDSWLWVRNAQEAVSELAVHGNNPGQQFEEISLDHDLGEKGPPVKLLGMGSGTDGIIVAKAIELFSQNPAWTPPAKMSCHSMNPVGRKNIEAAFESIRKVQRGQ